MKRARATHIFVTKKDRERDNRMKKIEEDTTEEATSEETLRGSVLKMVDSAVTDTEEIELKKLRPSRRKKQKEDTDQPRRDIYVVPGRIALTLPDDEPGPSTSFRAETIPEESSRAKGERRIGERKVEKRNAVEDLKEKLIDVKRKKNLLDIASRCIENDSDPKKGKKKGRQSNRKRSIFCYHELGTRLRLHFEDEDEDDTGEDAEMDKEVDELKIQGQDEVVEEWIDDKTIDKTGKDIPSISGNLETRPSLDMFKKYGGIPKKSFENLTKKDFEIINPDDENFEDVIYSPAPREKSKKLERKKKEKSPVVRELKDVFLRDTPTESIEELEEIEEIDTDPQIFFNYSSEESGNSMQLHEINLDNQNELKFSENLLEYPIEPTPSEESDSIHMLQRHDVACSSSTVRKIEKSLESTNVFRDRSSCPYLEDIVEYPREEDLEDDSTDMESSSMHKLWEVEASAPFDSRIIRPQTVLIQSSHGVTDYTAQRDESELIDNENNTNRITENTADTAEELNITQQQNVTVGSPAFQVCSNSNKDLIETSYSLNQQCCDSSTVTETVDGKYTGTDTNITGTSLTNPVIIQQSAIVGSNERLALKEIDVKVGKGKTGSCFVDVTEITAEQQVKSQPKIAEGGSKTVIKHSREKFRLKTGSQNLKIKSSDLEIITQPKRLSNLPDNQNAATDEIDTKRLDKFDAVGTPRKSKFSPDDQVPSTSKCSAACVGRSSKESKRPLRVCKSLLTSALFGSDGRDILSEEVLLRDIDMEKCLSAINKAKIEITTATRDEIAVATLGSNRAEFIQTHEYREEGTNPAEMNVITSIHSVLRPTCSNTRRCDNRRRMNGRPRWRFANKTKLNNFIYYKAPILREPKRDVFYRVPPSIDKSIQYDAPEIDIEDIFCSEKVVALSPKEKSRKRKKENKVNRWIAIWEGIQCKKVIDDDYEDKYEEDRYKVCDGAIVDDKGKRLFVKKDSFMMKDIKRFCECAYEKGKSALKVVYTDIKSDSEEKNESVIYNSKTQIDRSDVSCSRGWGSSKKEKRSTWKNMLGKVTKGKKDDQCQAKKLIKNLMGVNYLEIEPGKPDTTPRSSEDLEVVHKILPKCTKANQSNLENTASNVKLKGMEAIGVFRAELEEAQDKVEDDTSGLFPLKFRKRFLKRNYKNLQGTSVEEVDKEYKKHSSLERLAAEKERLHTKKERKRLSTAFRYKTRIICGRAFSLRNTSTDFINWMRRPRPRPRTDPESPLAQEIADVSESPSQESDRKDLDPEEVEGQREDVATGFFQDGRRVDYVLVLNNSDPHEVQNIKLDLLTAMARIGLEMEAEFGKLPENETYHFVKVYTPGAVLKKYGCVFNVLKYFRENHLKYINNSSMSSWFRTKHEREILKEIRKHYQRPLVLSNHDRSYITYMLLRQIRFGLPENFYGFSRLLENKIVVKGFALHDGPYLMSEHWQYRKYNARQLLFVHWGRYFLSSLRAQPLHIINEYFGSKLGFYFVFCEFYNRALAYAAVWGIFMFIAYTMKFPEYLDYTQYHMCKKPRSDFLIHLETVPNASIKYPLNYEYDYKGGQVCAECEPSDPPGRKLVSNDNRTRCPYQKLSNICPDLRLMQFFDNPYITVYSLGISVWALLFQRLWKRTEAFYSWMWEESVCPPLAVPRVEHKKKYTSTKPETCREKCNTFFLDIGRGSVTGILVPAIILLLTVLLTLAFFMYLYIDLSKPLSISKQLNDYFMMIYKPYDYLFLVLWTLLLLTLLCILEQICHFIALKLVNFENHRFQEDYESSLLQKVFSYSFVLMAAPTVYFAWIKGSFYYSPMESFTKFRLETWWRNYSINQSDFSRRLISQNCNPFSCFRQAVVVFITTVVFRFGIVAVIRDSFKRARYEPQWKKDEEPTTIEREFLMPAATTDVDVLFDTNALMVQFGIITMFAPLCPLAPVVALLVNLLHVKMKSRDLTMNSKRPILYKVKGIGAWNFIIKLICWGTPLFHALTVIRTEIFRRYLNYKTNVDLPNEWGRNNPMHREYKFARMLFLGRFNISMARQRGSKYFSYSSSILETMTNCSLDSFIYRPKNQTRNNTQWPFQPMLMDERWTDSAPLPVHYYSRYLKVAYILGFMLGAALLGLVLWQHLPSPAPAVARRRYRERTLRRLHCPRLRFTEDGREVHAQAR